MREGRWEGGEGRGDSVRGLGLLISVRVGKGDRESTRDVYIYSKIPKHQFIVYTS